MPTLAALPRNRLQCVCMCSVAHVFSETRRAISFYTDLSKEKERIRQNARQRRDERERDKKRTIKKEIEDQSSYL